MNKLMVTASSVLLICSTTNMAFADDDTGFYVGIGYANTTVDLDDFEDFGESIPQLGVRAGYMFTDHFGIDITGAVVGDASEDNVSFEVGMLGLSGIASLPLGDHFDLYGKLGAARVNASTSFLDVELSDRSSTELFWGLGGEVDFGMVNLFLEYNHFEIDGIDINTPMAGIKLEF